MRVLSHAARHWNIAARGATALPAESVPITYVAIRMGHWLAKDTDKSFVDSLDRTAPANDGTDFAADAASDAVDPQKPPNLLVGRSGLEPETR
jgi:hypothetical protein